MDDLEKQIASLREHLIAKERQLERFRQIHQPDDHLDRLLWSSGQHYKKILEAVPTPVVCYDAEGHTLFINQAFIDSYGFSQDEVLGQRIDFVPDDEMEPTRDAWQRTMRGEKVHFITKRYTKDKHIRIIEVHTAIINDQDGGHLASIVLHKDITDARLAAQEKLSKEKLKAAMETAGAVCHEMSQPLQVIQTTVELMRLNKQDMPPKTADRLQAIFDHAEQLGQIVKKLTLITRFRTKHYIDDTQILDLDQSSDKEE
jgi:PAS domain S-box-containing protein